ncbi:MAG: ChaN family lipoprotein [Desulfovibrionales bacterium]|nr:ChaN family lipoprotein [Desulfovibrionales bacterium]
MYSVMNNRGFMFDLEPFFSQITDYDITFVGESHDHRECQEAELEVLKGLWDKDPGIVLALEMFERDVQPVLDDYLAGVISEKTFLDSSRPWPGYSEQYRPLVEFARTRSIPVVAANIPRRAASAVAKAGEISAEVLAEDSVFLPPVIHVDSEEYYERFKDIVGGMHPAGPMMNKSVDGLFKAQVLKDAVMAASLEPYLGRRILFCCGRFHSDHHLGIPYQLHKNHPELKIAVMTFGFMLEDAPMTERSRVGDYIWIVDE